MSRYLGWGLTAWIAVTLFVYPIPHTIALRNLFLVAGFLALVFSYRQAPRPRLPDTLKTSAWWLAGLTVWIVLQAVAVTSAPTIALGNLRGDWIVPLLAGTFAAWGASRLRSAHALLAVVVPLVLHMAWMLGWQAWLRHQNLYAVGVMPFGGYDYQSTLAGFLLALLLSDRLALLLSGRSPCHLPPLFGWLLTAGILACEVLIRARNGTLVVLAMATAMLALLLADSTTRRRTLPIALLTVVAIGSIATASWQYDARWRGLTESVAVGWNSPSLYWLTNDPATRPATPSGAPLEESAYVRAAWAQQAVQAIGEHPLGLGFGRDGFGRAIAEKYGATGKISSHSGWLDFALGVGLPGLGLLLITTGFAVYGGWRQFRQHDDGVGLMFSFLVGSYLLRCLLDGHFSGWRLGLFAFIGGVLIACMKGARRES